MSISFNISSGGRGRGLLLAGLCVSGLAGLPAPGRPIEFSEPGNSSLTVNVSGLGAKPAALPSVDARVFRPHNYDANPDVSPGLKPLTRAAGLADRQNSRAPGLFDRDKNWLQQTPQEMLQSMMEKDALKLPASGAGNKSWDAAASWDPYNLPSTRRNGGAKTEARGGATNRLDSVAALNANDPFAVFSSRRPSPDYPATLDANVARLRGVADWLHTGDDSAADVRRERMDAASQLDEFRRPPGFQTPGGNSGWLYPAATPGRGRAVGTDVEKSARTQGASAAGMFNLPSAPLAPIAPIAPGPTSLTPAPYSPAAKPKPLEVSAPRRVF